MTKASTGLPGQADESIHCIRDLLVVALRMIDDLGLPSEIGAQLDSNIHELSQLIEDRGLPMQAAA